MLRKLICLRYFTTHNTKKLSGRNLKKEESSVPDVFVSVGSFGGYRQLNSFTVHVIESLLASGLFCLGGGGGVGGVVLELLRVQGIRSSGYPARTLSNCRHHYKFKFTSLKLGPSSLLVPATFHLFVSRYTLSDIFDFNGDLSEDR